jgi:tetratricopeptide (TPR) repeat protein
LRRIRAVALYAVGRRTEAEEEWLTALALSPGDAVGNASVWSQLADMYEKQGRIPEAVHAWQHSVSLATDSPNASNVPLKITKARALVRLSRLYIEAAQPRAALQALDEAMRNATPGMLRPSGGRTFSFNVAQGRAAAWWALGDAKQATSFEEEAVKLDPDASDAWTHLAKLYAKQGRVEEQHRAEARATALGTPQPPQSR